jgi:ATP-dependent RNA helicase RhlE
MLFTEFNLDDSILEAISYMGFKEPTPIQEMAIPLILEGRDLIACAQTGTGKTAAFILPVLNQIAANPQKQTSALIIVPTRELALQIDQQIQGFAYFLGIHSLPIYGGGDGQEFNQQMKALGAGAEIVVATPGKLISHLNMGNAEFGSIQHLILDEADRMLDMGFMDDIKKIISYLPEKRQSLMFSATMPNKIRKFAKELLTDPEEIAIALSKPAEGSKN